jgi:hypothetical protein
MDRCVVSRPPVGYRIAELIIAICLTAVSAAGQDVLTVGSGAGQPSATVTVPIYVRDVAGTPLGSDAGSGKRIQGFGFKITYSPAASVSAVAFSRAGVLASLTPLFENTIFPSAAIAYVGSFSETSSPVPLTLSAAPPGDPIGNLQIQLSASAPVGGSVVLSIASTATLSNQAGTVGETNGNGLSLVNGSVSVSAPPFGAPAGVTATAITTSQVSVTWLPMSGVDHFEVFRSSNGSAYAMAGSPTTNSFNDTPLTAGVTYLYYVRAVAPGGATSSNSAIDYATTIAFTDEPLVAGVVVKAIHLSELRAAVNAFRVAASQPRATFTDSASPSIPIRALHIQELRNALAAARTMLGFSAIAFTDPTLTPGVTPIRAAHVQELRNAVK